MAKIWTKEEEIILKELVSQGMSRQEMADYFGVTISSIQNKVRRLKLTRKPNENIRFFKVIDTEEKAYWLGFIYADGYVVYNKKQGNYELGIELNEIDIEHLKKFNKCFNNGFKISTRQKTQKSGNIIDMCNIRLYSKDLVEDLMNNGIVPNKTYSEVFPIIEDEKLFFHFLRGYIDGDGSYVVAKVKTSKRVIEYPRITITGNNRKCLEYILERLQEYNISSHIIKDRNNFRLEISQKQSCKEIIEKLYFESNISLDRKVIKSKELLNL